MADDLNRKPSAAAKGLWPNLKFGEASGAFVGLILLCVGFSLSSEHFFSVRNALNILDQITVLGILAVGMTMVIIIGGIDLSVGSVLALSTMMLGWMMRDIGAPLPVCILVGILAGGLCGLISGLLITWGKLPPFVATLAMLSSARGMANILTDGRQIIGYSEWFTDLAIVRHFGFLSITMTVFIVIAIVGWIYLRFRAEGRNLYAVGGNPEVARLAGIRVRAVNVWVYAASGLMAGVAGIALAARLDSSQPSAGVAYELDTIAAVVIGGASLSGGKGGIVGTVVGVFIIGVLRNGLNLLAVSPFIQQVIIGGVIAAAVMIDTLGRRRAG